MSNALGRSFMAAGAFLANLLYGGDGENYERLRAPRSAVERTEEAQKDFVVPEKLPGLYFQPNFEQFAGYLDAAPTRHVFYWYVESQNDPENDPVVLWTNGGPGCSGLLGFGAEHGPFVISRSGKLHDNQYSWNKIANMLYLEQPAGVGFSFCDTMEDKVTGDAQAATDNYHVILEFLKKFPERAKNPFYLSSESYGGHYIPQLAMEIIRKDKNHKINFAGFFLGNPYVDPYSNTLTQFESYYSHGLLARPIFDEWANVCKDPGLYMSHKCDKITDVLFDSFGDGINPYALDYPVCVDTKFTFSYWDSIEDAHEQRRADSSKGKDKSTTKTASQQVESLLHYSKVQPPFLPKKDSYKPCSQVVMELWLNQHDVRSALHVRDNAAYKWSPCGGTDVGGIEYSPADVDTPVTQFYQDLIDLAVAGNHSLKMMIYSGDDDSICSTAGTQYWIWDLGVKAKKLWRPWQVKFQTAGFVTHFDLGENSNATFSFATVHAAGHEVPAYRPMEALDLFDKFLNDKW